MQHSFPLTPDILNRIKANIKQLSEGYQTLKLDAEDLGFAPGGRATTESMRWPKEGAIDFFVKEGAVRRVGLQHEKQFEIIKPEYFSIAFDNLALPVQFSIDRHIEANLIATTALQADLFEIENRLRYVFEERLIQVYGSTFVSSLPQDVQSSISREKSNPKWHITETRTRELEYTNFSDLLKVLVMPNLYVDDKARKALLDKLDYLNEARTRIAHNNPVSGEDNIKIKDYANQVRQLLPQLKNQT